MGRQNLIALLFFLYVSIFVFSFDINCSARGYEISFFAELLQGTPTSMYPRENFINYVLYGQTAIHFYYIQFLTSYGTKISQFYEGSLVVGNDANLGGIVIMSGNVAIAIPGSQVTFVPIDQIDKFFPKGYTILYNRDPKETYFWGDNQSSTLTNLLICPQCFSEFLSIQDDPANVQVNYPYRITIYNYDIPFQLHMYGFVQSFDSTQKKGVMKVNWYQIPAKGQSSMFLADPNYSNLVQVILNANNTISLQGSVYIIFVSVKGIYNFYDNLDHKLTKK